MSKAGLRVVYSFQFSCLFLWRLIHQTGWKDVLQDMNLVVVHYFKLVWSSLVMLFVPSGSQLISGERQLGFTCFWHMIFYYCCRSRSYLPSSLSSEWLDLQTAVSSICSKFAWLSCRKQIGARASRSELSAKHVHYYWQLKNPRKKNRHQSLLLPNFRLFYPIITLIFLVSVSRRFARRGNCATTYLARYFTFVPFALFSLWFEWCCDAFVVYLSSLWCCGFDILL